MYSRFSRNFEANALEFLDSSLLLKLLGPNDYNYVVKPFSKGSSKYRNILNIYFLYYFNLSANIPCLQILNSSLCSKKYSKLIDSFNSFLRSTLPDPPFLLKESKFQMKGAEILTLLKMG